MYPLASCIFLLSGCSTVYVSCSTRLPSPREEVHHEVGVPGEGCHVNDRPAVPGGQPHVGAVPDQRTGQANLAAGLANTLKRSHAVISVLVYINLVAVHSQEILQFILVGVLEDGEQFGLEAGVHFLGGCLAHPGVDGEGGGGGQGGQHLLVDSPPVRLLPRAAHILRLPLQGCPVRRGCGGPVRRGRRYSAWSSGNSVRSVDPVL